MHTAECQYGARTRNQEMGVGNAEVDMSKYVSVNFAVSRACRVSKINVVEIAKTEHSVTRSTLAVPTVPTDYSIAVSTRLQLP